MIPSTAPAHTKPKTVPSLSKPKCDSKGVKSIEMGKQKGKEKEKGKEKDLVENYKFSFDIEQLVLWQQRQKHIVLFYRKCRCQL